MILSVGIWAQFLRNCSSVLQLAPLTGAFPSFWAEVLIEWSELCLEHTLSERSTWQRVQPKLSQQPEKWKIKTALWSQHWLFQWQEEEDKYAGRETNVCWGRASCRPRYFEDKGTNVMQNSHNEFDSCRPEPLYETGEQIFLISRLLNDTFILKKA